MDHLHQSAIDVLSGRLGHTPRHQPESRHHLLHQQLAADERTNFPWFAPSTAITPSQGVAIRIGLEPHQTTTTALAPTPPISSTQPPVDESERHLVFHHLGSRSWLSRNYQQPFGSPTHQWIGVELGNIHLLRRPHRYASSSTSAFPTSASSRLQPTRFYWLVQNYLVRAHGQTEQVFDTSFFTRMFTKSNDINSSSFTFQTSCVVNLAHPPTAAPNPAIPSANVDVFSPKSNLLVGGVEIGYDTAPQVNPMRTKLFVDSDGLAVGGSILKRWDRIKSSTDSRTSTSKAAATTSSTFSRRWSALWPIPLYVRLGSTSGGFEYVWVQSEKDFSGSFGFSQQFRLRSSNQPVPHPKFQVPPSTLAWSMQFYGHIMASLHVPITPRLTVATSYHTQITNDETLVIGAVQYRLNQSQQVSFSLDSRGGLRFNWQSRVRPIQPLSSSSPTTRPSWLTRILSRTHLTAHLQAFPLLPALTPKWNIASVGLTGDTYSPVDIRAMRSTQISGGISLEYESE